MVWRPTTYERLYFVPYEKICSKTAACKLFRSFVRPSFVRRDCFVSLKLALRACVSQGSCGVWVFFTTRELLPLRWWVENSGLSVAILAQDSGRILIFCDPGQAAL